MQQGKDKGRGQAELGRHGGEQDRGNRNWAIALVPCFSSLSPTLKYARSQLLCRPLLLALPGQAPLRLSISFTPYQTSTPSSPDPSLPVTQRLPGAGGWGRGVSPEVIWTSSCLRGPWGEQEVLGEWVEGTACTFFFCISPQTGPAAGSGGLLL